MTELTMIMEVTGMKISLQSVLIWMSPGRCPNQVINQGAKCSAIPTTTRTTPVVH